MKMIDYYLGTLGISKESSEQAKLLREIVLSDKSEVQILEEFNEFVLSQSELRVDTVSIINKSLMTGYGCEYMGLGKDNFSLKAGIYRRFIEKFPEAYSLKFKYADCCLMCDSPVEEIYPILREAMLADKENIEYPTSDLFYLIHSSTFSFEFDMLLLDKYYQPCEKGEFEEWIKEFKETYKAEGEQEYLKQLKWKGQNASR